MNKATAITIIALFVTVLPIGLIAQRTSDEDILQRLQEALHKHNALPEEGVTQRKLFRVAISPFGDRQETSVTQIETITTNWSSLMRSSQFELWMDTMHTVRVIKDERMLYLQSNMDHQDIIRKQLQVSSALPDSIVHHLRLLHSTQENDSSESIVVKVKSTMQRFYNADTITFYLLHDRLSRLVVVHPKEGGGYTTEFELLESHPDYLGTELSTPVIEQFIDNHGELKEAYQDFQLIEL